MSVHVYYVFMSGRPDRLEKINELIGLHFKIQESIKVKRFLGLYYKLGHDENFQYTKKTVEKDVKELVDGYKKLNKNISMLRKILALLAELYEIDNSNNL